MCGHQAEQLKAIRHIDNIFKQPESKKTSKTGQNNGFKDILTSENPRNNSNFNLL